MIPRVSGGVLLQHPTVLREKSYLLGQHLLQHPLCFTNTGRSYPPSELSTSPYLASLVVRPKVRSFSPLRNVKKKERAHTGLSEATKRKERGGRARPVWDT